MNVDTAIQYLNRLIESNTIYSYSGFSLSLEKEPDLWNQVLKSIGLRESYRYMSKYLCDSYYKKFSVPFLFKETCVAFELRYHINAYLSILGFRGYLRHITTFLFTKQQIIRHCKSVEISIDDLRDIRQKIIFRYRTGIRTEFRYTSTDPYARTISFFGHKVLFR